MRLFLARGGAPPPPPRPASCHSPLAQAEPPLTVALQARFWIRGVNTLPLGSKHAALLALARKHHPNMEGQAADDYGDTNFISNLAKSVAGAND